MYFQLHDIFILLSIDQAEALLVSEKNGLMGLCNGFLTQTAATSERQITCNISI